MGQPGVLFSRSRGSTKIGLPLRSSVAKLSCEAATEENAKRRSFMPRTQVTSKANFSPGITSGLPVTRPLSQTKSPKKRWFSAILNIALESVEAYGLCRRGMYRPVRNPRPLGGGGDGRGL